jgi:parvulin-like peptidyl-prolyl isomerase
VRTRIETKRLVALVLGVALIATVVGFVIWGDVGDPDVSGDEIAVVEDAPDGEISQEDFDAALEQAASNLNLQQVPPPDNPQYEQVKQAALAQLIQTRWIRGEAAERGIEPADRDIDQQLDQIIQTQLGGQQGYEQFLKQSPYTEEDVREVAEISLLSTRIQEESVPTTAPEVSEAEIEENYEATVEQYVEPATRDVRQILNREQAKVEQAKQMLEQDDSAQSWKRVAERYSTDDATSSQGGLRRDVVQGQSEPALDAQIFTAPVGELVGPFQGDGGWYLIQVVAEQPERTTPLSEVSDQIHQQIQQGKQAEISAAFQEDFLTKWRSRTFCADEYAGDLCANSPPAADTCPTDDPAERERAEPEVLEQGCEAPVTQRPVVDPGDTFVAAGGQPNAKYQDVQRPLPAGVTTTPPPGTVPLGPQGAPPVPPG